MTAVTDTKPPTADEPSALEVFLQALERRITDSAQLRLVRAAGRKDPAPALERTLHAIVEEILHET